MPFNQPVLSLKKLTIQREVPILQSIDWNIFPGEHWVILGANGSGKTSLLAALTAYLTPTSGEIEIFGQRYGETDWRELRKEIGIVSSTVHQMIREDETVLNVVVSGKEAIINYWGNPNSEEIKQAKKILKEIKSEKLKDRIWGYLSQGERQRILIGRALMANPKILILDEPCAGLDLVARENFLKFLNQLAKKKKGPTLILVTHHVEEIVQNFTHLLILKNGKVLAAGKKSILNSKIISEAFQAKIKIQKSKNRFSASVKETKRKVV